MIDFEEEKLDALLVSSLPNVRYLTGFTGSSGMVLLTPESMTLLTDPRYGIQAREESRQALLPTRVSVSTKQLWQTAVQTVQRRRLKRVGFEAAHLSFELHKTMASKLPSGYALKPVGKLVEQLRMVKTNEEVALIRASVATNSAAFEAVVRQIKPGMSENDVAAELDYQMRKLGAESTAFETIVASGARTAWPHARPTGKTLNANELLLIDVGACQGGYMSDMTRMLFIGKPEKKIRAAYAAVLKAQLAAIDAVRDGAATRKVDAAARLVLEAVGLQKAFVHSTGHGLGLEIHEPPRIGKKDKAKLKAGMVITIEPGAYVEGVGGFRVEDTVLVTATGCEVLTPTSKELRLI